MYSNQYFGGKKRFYYSAVAETTFNTAVSRDRVLNPLDGSELVGPPNKEMLPNDNSAQGQGEWATRVDEGAEDHQGSPTFHLTPEAFGKFCASAFGADTKSTVDTSAIQHAMTLNSSGTPKAFTIEEHTNGATDTTNSWILSGSYAHAFTINVNPGNQYATISPHIVGSKYAGAGIDQSAAELDDDTEQWPNVVGVAPTKCGLWIDIVTDGVSDFDGDFSPFTTQGTPENDLSGAVNAGVRSRSFSLTYDTGVDLQESYRAGTSAGSGFVRGQPYGYQRKFTITAEFDLDASTDSFLTAWKDWSGANSYLYTAQFAFATDDKVGGTYYSGGHLVCNLMRIVGKPRLSTGIGPATVSVDFEGMEAASGETAYVEAVSWDDIDVDYA
jgi:hypothetical protein